MIRLLTTLLRSKEGNFSTITAVTAVPLVALAGTAMDYSRLTQLQVKLQGAVDSAVLATAADASTSRDQRVATGNEFYASNVQNPCTTSPIAITIADKTVTGTAQCDLQTSFLGVVGMTKFTVKATATAEVTEGAADGACVIALDPTTKETFNVSGSGVVSVPNCGIYVNSASSTALKQSGAGQITAKNIWVVGAFGKASNVSPKPLIGQQPIPDPLAGVAEPAVPAACNYSNFSFNSPMVFPAGTVFCGKTAFNGSATFSPGVHYFKGATVTTASNANLSGSEVMLFFDATSVLSKSAGTGTVSLSAPTSGPYKGIALFSSRNAQAGLKFILNGNKDYFVNGSVYLPKAILEMYGTVELAATAKSGYVIAWRFFYQGDSSFMLDTFGGPTAIGSPNQPVKVRLTQ